MDIRLQDRPIWLVGVAAALAGSVATEVYGLVARGVGVPMEAGSFGAAESEPITVGLFAMGTLMSSFWGIVLAVLLARFAKHPSRTFVRATIVLTAVSLAGPLGAGDTALSTKLMLCLAHLIAAAIIIPPLARRLSSVRDRTAANGYVRSA